MPLINMKNLVAPKFYERTWEHLRIGDNYYKVLLVTNLPENFLFGLFRWSLNNEENVKYFYVTRPIKDSMSKALTNEMKRKRERFDSSRDELAKQRLVNEIANLEMAIADLAASNNRTLDMMLVIMVKAMTAQDLTDRTNTLVARLTTTYGFKIFTANGLQEALFQTVLPFWKKSKLTKDLDYRYRIPLSTRSMVLCWPYYYEDVRDPNGLLLGYTRRCGGLFIQNPFLWEDYEKIARPLGIGAGNMVILGKTGSGKTTTITKYANWFLREGVRLVWFDPNNQNINYVQKNRGRYISFGAKGNIINVLELKRVGDGNDNTMVDPYDLKMAKDEAIRDFKEVVKLYNPNNANEVEKALNIVDEIIYKVYDKFNIVGESFEHFKSTDYPIIADVLEEIRKEEAARKKEYGNDAIYQQLVNLELYVQPLVHADGMYFNGHTTLDFNNSDDMLFGFGTKLLDNAPDNIKNTIYYLIMKEVSSILFDASRKCACIWDEFEKVALNGYTLPMCSDLCRMVRKYHSVMVLGMQEPSDLATDVVVRGATAKSYGTAIMNNATYKIIMQLEQNAVDKLSELISLSDYEYEQIPSLITGDAFFFRNLHHHEISVFANQNDLKTMKVE